MGDWSYNPIYRTYNPIYKWKGAHLVPSKTETRSLKKRAPPPDAVAVDPSMRKPCHPAASQAPANTPRDLGVLKFRNQKSGTFARYIQAKVDLPCDICITFSWRDVFSSKKGHVSETRFFLCRKIVIGAKVFNG